MLQGSCTSVRASVVTCLRLFWCRVGRYAEDAYKIFVEGRWQETRPLDKELAKYYEWLEETGGLGTGLQRDTVPEYRKQNVIL